MTPTKTALVLSGGGGRGAYHIGVFEELVRQGWIADGQGPDIIAGTSIGAINAAALASGLIERCDCFVSLHRSEGFGRGIAEAMMLRKPVIVTGYSGNMDFTNSQNACIVDYRLVDVGPGEYPFPEGQRWADPDLEQAASYMRRLVGDPAWGAALAEKGRELVEAQHGVGAVGRRYRARLEELGFV